MPWARVEPWPDGLDRLRDLGFTCAALTPGPDSIVLDAIDRSRPIAFMLGSEGPGLTPAALARADVRVRIPMAPGVDSLNVAATSALAFRAIAERTRMIDDVSDGGRPVAAVERAIAVLDVLADGAGPRGVNELARALGAHPSTVSRLLGTLAEAGLVEREAGSGHYRLGLRLAYWGSAAIAGRDLRELARPLLAELSGLTGETSTLSLAAGTEAVTADYVASSQTVLSQARVGRASVGHATAVGKVLLAFRPDALAALPAELERFTSATIVDRAELERELEAVRARGYGEASGEREVGLHAIAVPVLDGRGELAAILGLQGPDRFDAEARSRALDPLLERAARLGAALST